MRFSLVNRYFAKQERCSKGYELDTLSRNLSPAHLTPRVTITHEQFTSTEDRDKHNEGWNGCLNRLQRQLSY
jgi:hypothetical protein